MNKDKKVLYILSILLFAVLLFSLFVDLGSSKVVTAILLLPFTFAVCMLIRKRCALSINKREVLLLLAVVAVIYVVLLQATGLHFGLYKNPYVVSLKRPERIFTTVIPLAVIIVTSEIIRAVLLAQKNKPVSVLAFCICLVAELLMFSHIPGITSFNKFMDFVGLTLFPALSANIFYHYISKNFGMAPNIAFRIITELYLYVLPTTSAMPDALTACVQVILPVFLLTFVSALYEKKKKNARQKGQKLGLAATVLTIAGTIALTMLISCQFRFGALVIATESMTGEINKGDMIIYERYENQPITEGQVIVFQQNEAKIVHRVVKIEHIKGETRYYTKGDANESMDPAYRTLSDIVGLTDMKIAYVGYPTLMLRDILSK